MKYDHLAHKKYDTGRLMTIDAILKKASEWHYNGNVLIISHPGGINNFLSVTREDQDFFGKVVDIKHAVTYVVPDRSIYRIENSQNFIIEAYDCWF